MGDGKYRAICTFLEPEYGLDFVGEVLPFLAEMNDKLGVDNLSIVVLPSRYGSRFMLLRTIPLTKK